MRLIANQMKESIARRSKLVKPSTVRPRDEGRVACGYLWVTRRWLAGLEHASEEVYA